jgi:hypothetical protein
MTLKPMKLSRDALGILALFVVLCIVFVWAGMLWWAAFIFAVGLVLAAFEGYLYVKEGVTLSQQFWQLWREKPKLALALWLALLTAFAAILLHLKG